MKLTERLTIASLRPQDDLFRTADHACYSDRLAPRVTQRFEFSGSRVMTSYRSYFSSGKNEANYPKPLDPILFRRRKKSESASMKRGSHHQLSYMRLSGIPL